MVRVKKPEKQYGPHDFMLSPDNVECLRGCGCWYNSDTGNGGGEQFGLDHNGQCPQNPLDGKPLGGNLDNIAVIESRLKNEKRKLSKTNFSRRLSRAGTKRRKLLRDLENVLTALKYAPADG